MTDDEGLESERTEAVESERTEATDPKGTDTAEAERPIEFEADRAVEFESDAASGSVPSASDRDDIDRTGPLGDLAASVADRGDAPGGAEASSPAFDELFDREDAADIDRDRLWDRLEDDDETATAPRAEDREIREIETDSYCHRCEHFASPPTVACTREGTDVLEMPSLGRFRVADCPVVLEDEALEKRD